MAPRPRKETFTVCGEVGASVAVVDHFSGVPIGTPEGRGGRRARQPLSTTKTLPGRHASVRFLPMVSILTISGMVAVHSKRAVFTALAGVVGVVSAEVEMGRAVIEHDARVTPDALADA